MRRLAVLAAVLALLSGCGGGGDDEAAPSPPATTAVAPEPVPAPDTSRPTMEAVVRAWSENLNAGRNDVVARLFALGAIVVQGGAAFEFETYEQLEQWHAGLPCSGRIVQLTFEGEFAVAVFELGDRLTSPCDAAPGTLAAARFLIRGGKIVAWEQIPPPETLEPSL